MPVEQHELHEIHMLIKLVIYILNVFASDFKI